MNNHLSRNIITKTKSAWKGRLGNIRGGGSLEGAEGIFYNKFKHYVRVRTVGSRKPAPASTHLLKGDPDSATSPSKYPYIFPLP